MESCFYWNGGKGKKGRSGAEERRKDEQVERNGEKEGRKSEVEEGESTGVLGVGASGRERAPAPESERAGMNGKGQEATGEPASSLPGFALLGSSLELRVTDHQTDRADIAATAGTNLSVGMEESPLSPPAPSRRTS